MIDIHSAIRISDCTTEKAHTGKCQWGKEEQTAFEKLKDNITSDKTMISFN